MKKGPGIYVTLKKKNGLLNRVVEPPSAYASHPQASCVQQTVAFQACLTNLTFGY